MNYRQNWAYRVPHFSFDGAADGTGGAASPVAPSAPAAPSSAPGPSSEAPPAGGTPSSPSPDGGSGATEHDPFSGLDGSFDDDLDTVIIAPGPPTDGGPAPSATPASPIPAPAAPPAPAAVPPSEQVVAAPVEQPARTSPVSARAQLDQTVDGFKANEPALAQWAASNLFKLSVADAEALATNAEEALPQMAGRVYAAILSATGNMIRNLVPNVIQESIETTHSTRTRASEAIEQFYKDNPDLNEKDHGPTVATWAKQFRAANPKATRPEAIAFVARAVRIQHGMPMPGTPVPAQGGRPQPFAPARPGGRSPAPVTEHDPYAGLGMEFDIE